MVEDEKSSDQKKKSGVSPASGAWIAIGVGVGVAIGVAIDNIGLGIAIGAAVGAAFTAAHAGYSRGK